MITHHEHIKCFWMAQLWAFKWVPSMSTLKRPPNQHVTGWVNGARTTWNLCNLKGLICEAGVDIVYLELIDSSL